MVDKRKKPWSSSEESRDAMHFLLRLDGDATKQVNSSTRQKSAAGEGNGSKGAGVVARLVYDGLEYLDGEDVVIERHWVDGGQIE